MFQSIGKAFKKIINRFNKKQEIQQSRTVESVQESVQRSVQPEIKNKRRSKKANPPWWYKVFGTRKKPKDIPLNLQPVKCFGNFSPVKPLGSNKKAI